MTLAGIPIIDFARFSAQPQTVADDLLKACTDWGFFYVKNHTIPQAHIDNLFQLSKAFFAQPDDVKNQTPYIPAQNAGFKPSSSYGADAKSKKVDPREAFSINKLVDEDAVAAARFPPWLSEHREMIRDFQREAQSLAYKLLECVALALGLPEGQFTSKHARSKPNFDNFELMHYPALQPSEVSTNRISPHTDWGSITLLFQQDIGGLQVRPPHYTSPTLSPSEVWTDAPVYNDMILINIGDMMEFWTAGLLKSTWHRVTSNTVANPGHGFTDRYCLAYFLHPDKDSVLEPLEQFRKVGYVSRYDGQVRSAAEHIAMRINAIHGSKDKIKMASQKVVEAV